MRKGNCEGSSSYQKSHIESVLSKVKIIDGSLDKKQIETQTIEYFERKNKTSILNKSKCDFIDLFCGAGGLSVGLEHEGFKPILALDKDDFSLQTYRFNRPWMSEDMIIQGDIRLLVENSIFPHVPLIVGGPPCQGFSVANKHKKENDERNELYKFYVHAVEQSNPDFFLMENVEGILKVFDDIRGDFKRIGYYACEPLILTPKDFGFPQSRRRVFILGINNKHKSHKDELYQIFKASIEEKRVGVLYTLRDAIMDLPALRAKSLKNATYSECKDWGYTIADFHSSKSKYVSIVNDGLENNIPLLNHKSKYNNDRDILIFQTLKPGEKSDAESIQEINPYKSREHIFKDKFDKLLLDEPCKAITAHMYYDCNMYIHPTQARGLTPREAARVQGFPDDYLFLGSPNEWYRQVGNAVSPLMARVIGNALMNLIQRV